MKKIAIPLIITTMFMLSSFPVYALENDVTVATNAPTELVHDAVSVVDWTKSTAKAESPHATQPPTISNSETAKLVPVRDVVPTYHPKNVETVTENGTLIIKKTFEVSEEIDPQTLVQPFAQDGMNFIQREILREKLPSEKLTRLASKVGIVESKGNNKADILKEYPNLINHDEDGYSGQLQLDSTTLVTEVDEYETYAYPYTRTKEFSTFERNDPSYFEKGVSGMRLTGLSFVGVNNELVGNSLVPNKYKAIAKYSGTGVGKRAISYVSTATYFGEITKEIHGNILYTVVYEGKPIVSEVITEKTQRRKIDHLTAAIIGGISVVIGGVCCILAKAAQKRKRRHRFI